MFEDEQRMAKAHPVFQEFRLYQTINALRLRNEEGTDRSLTLDERDALVLLAKQRKKITFASMRKTIKASKEQRRACQPTAPPARPQRPPRAQL